MANRRQRGSGSIRKLGKALYLRYRPPGHARQVETAFPRIPGETMPDYRKRAEAELAKITLGLAAGPRSAPTPRTVDELAESFLASVRPSVKARAYEGYERHLSLYVLPLVGKLKVASLSTADIRRVQRQLLDRKVAGGTMALSTAREAMTRLHDMVRHAMDGADSREYWGITFDPWPLRGLRWPDNRERPAPRTFAPYSVDEARRYIQAAPGTPTAPRALCSPPDAARRRVQGDEVGESRLGQRPVLRARNTESSPRFYFYKNKPLFLSLQAAAAESGLSASYLRKLIRLGQLPAFKGDGNNGCSYQDR